ncbi:MAG: NAD(+)/NADH kinase [Acidobacteria bacterium]|nr:NAD(+)/NADH kinase [Acidobacteriota bacterium]
MATKKAIASKNVTLFGAEADSLRSEFEPYDGLILVDDDPDIVVCYGGDGTLLSAEHRWPGIPKVPIRNSRRGKRMMGHPVNEVVQRLAEGALADTAFIKLRCAVADGGSASTSFSALNEVNVQLARSNAAVRFKIWIDDIPFEHGIEFIGDGFVVSTPFGSTAYYKQITRGVFYSGLGIAFKSTSELVNHVVVPETASVRIRITRGPAVLAYDNCEDFASLDTGAELLITRDESAATILTWETMTRPSDQD